MMIILNVNFKHEIIKKSGWRRFSCVSMLFFALRYIMMMSIWIILLGNPVID
jgi:hypothetical protein